MNVNSKTGIIRSGFDKCRERFAVNVKKHELDNLEFSQRDKILKDVITGCKENYFHTIEYRCDYDIKYT